MICCLKEDKGKAYFTHLRFFFFHPCQPSGWELYYSSVINSCVIGVCLIRSFVFYPITLVWERSYGDFYQLHLKENKSVQYKRFSNYLRWSRVGLSNWSAPSVGKFHLPLWQESLRTSICIIRTVIWSTFFYYQGYLFQKEFLLAQNISYYVFVCLFLFCMWIYFNSVSSSKGELEREIMKFILGRKR